MRRHRTWRPRYQPKAEQSVPLSVKVITLIIITLVYVIGVPVDEPSEKRAA